MRLKDRLRLHSLNSRVIFIVLLCWMVPVIMLGTSVMLTYNRGIRPRVLESNIMQVNAIITLISERLDRIMDLSKSVTYEGILEAAYNDYQRNRGQPGQSQYLHQRCMEYLSNKFAYSDEIILSYLFFVEEPSIYASRQNDYTRLHNFTAYRYSFINDLASGLDTRPEILGVDNEIYLIRNLMNGSGDRFGTLVLQIEPQDLFASSFDEGSVWRGREAFWFNGRIGYTQGGITEVEALRRASNMAMWSRGGAVANLQRDTIEFTGVYSSTSYTLAYLMLLPRDELDQDYYAIMQILLYAILVLVPVLFLTQYYVHRHVIRPIDQLISATSHLASGQLGEQIALPASEDELSALVTSFNTMSSELQYLVQFVYKEELMLKDAKYASLQSQINPHFLNNTLEMINWHARMSGDEVTSNVIEALSLLLNTGMNRADKREITIREEMRFAEAYLFIITQRFGERLTVSLHVDPELLDNLVPPLILQPLLENAVVHGIEPIKKGELLIDIRREDAQIHMHIENDGKPIGPDQAERIRLILEGKEVPGERRNSLGLRNVNARLRLLYGNRYQLTIRTGENGRTWTDVYIPLRQEVPRRPADDPDKGGSAQ